VRGHRLRIVLGDGSDDGTADHQPYDHHQHRPGQPCQGHSSDDVHVDECRADHDRFPGAPCTEAALATATSQSSPGTTVVSFACSGSYAYAFVDIPSPAPPTGGGSIEATFVFTSAGSSWQRADRATVCPSVPAAIYQNACQTN